MFGVYLILAIFAAFLIFIAIGFCHPDWDPASACIDDETGEMICSYYDS